MLKIENLSYKVETRKILDNISLNFKNGEIVVITGGNGSGKTTLLKIIMGILQADAGNIFLDNQNITNFSIDKRANLGLSLAFQQPPKFKGLTVAKLLELAENKKSNLSSACENLSKVGLCARDYLNREFDNSLSGGERKRIEIALSLARNSQTCLFDEPEAGIDMWSFENLVKIFLELKKQGKCVVIVSHNRKILEIADKVLYLNNGKTEFFKNNKSAIEQLLPLTCIKLQGGKNEEN